MKKQNFSLPWYMDFMPLFTSEYSESVFGNYLKEIQKIFQKETLQKKIFSILKEEMNEEKLKNCLSSVENPLSYFNNLNCAIYDAILDSLKEEIESQEYDRNTFVGLNFVISLIMDPISPKNAVFLKNDYWKNIFDNRGVSFIRGWENFYNDTINNGGVVSAVNKSQHSIGVDIANTAGSVVWQNELVQLIRYKSPNADAYSVPLLIVPPFINKYYILDLGKDKSVVNWILNNGYDVFLISWRSPDKSMVDFSIEDYVLRGIEEAIDATTQLLGVDKINCIGYCIGGTFLMILAAYFASCNKQVINSITLLNSMLDFSFPGPSGIFINDILIQYLTANKPLIEGHLMCNFFRWLRSGELFWNYVRQNYWYGKELQSSDMMYWNEDTPPLIGKMFTEYLKTCYIDNGLTISGYMKINNKDIDMSSVACPIYIISAIKDHITPPESIFEGAKMFEDVVFTLSKSGHVMSIVGIPGFKKYAHYSGGVDKKQTLEEWTANAEYIDNDSSWWNHWNEWQSKLSGKKKKMHPLDEIQPAPGNYVKEN